MLEECLQYFTVELVYILLLKDVYFICWGKKEVLIVKWQ